MFWWYQRAWHYLITRAYIGAVLDDACDVVNSIRLIHEAIGGKNLIRLVFGTIIKLGAAVGVLRLLLML